MTNVLSLFNGISGARVALDRVGIAVTKFYSSEIDRFANAITDYQYPDTIQLGDITKWQEWDLPEIDLIVGGFPCTSYSVAGKRLGTKCPKNGRLIYDFIDVLRHYKPKHFLIENVKGFMSIEKGEVLKLLMSDLEDMGYEPEYHLINSALLSAQNRQRIYITNIQGIKQPEDKGILLKDIVEKDHNEDVAPRNERNDREFNKSGDKSNCLLASCYKGAGNNGMPLVEYVVKLDKHDSKVGLKCVGGLLGTKKWIDDGKNLQRNFSQGERIYSTDDKSPTLNAQSGGTAGVGSALIEEPKILCGASMVGRRINKGKRDDYNHDIKPKQYIEINQDPTKSRCLSTVQKDTLLADKDKGRHEPEQLKYRKLTPVECCRLQNYPDTWCDIGIFDGIEKHISNTQKYKALGNSFTVDVIAHIFKGIS